MGRLLQIRTSDHHLLTAHPKCSLNNIMEVVIMSRLSVIDSSEDWITQIDSYLQLISIQVDTGDIKSFTSAYLNLL